MGKNTLADLNIQDKLAQRDRKHRYKSSRENKQHLEGVETITRTGETDQDVTVPTPLSRGATWRPTWEHIWLTGVSVVEVGDEGWIQDVSSGNPAPLFQAVTLPVNQVLETPAPWSNTQEAFYRVCRMAFNDTGRGVGLGTEDKQQWD